MLPTTQIRTIATTIHGRFLVERVGDSPRPVVLAGFHGYAQNADAMMDPLRAIAPANSMIVSIQALHRFYRRSDGGVVASWLTREDRGLLVDDNVEYVRRVIADVATVCELGPLVFVGFSQGASMAWRAAALSGVIHSGIIALGGDLPPEIDLPALRSIPRSLVGRGTTEEWYTDELMRRDVARLESAGVPLEAVVFEGGHEWTEDFLAKCRAFVNSIVLGEPDQGFSV